MGIGIDSSEFFFFFFCIYRLLTSPSPFPEIYFYYLPYITLGALAVGSAFSALFLPETFRKPLPQTIEQMPKRKGWVANERLFSMKTTSASKLLFTSKHMNDCVILCQQNKVPIQVKSERAFNTRGAFRESTLTPFDCGVVPESCCLLFVKWLKPCCSE